MRGNHYNYLKIYYIYQVLNRSFTYQNFCLLRGQPLKKGIGEEKKCFTYTYDPLNRITSATDNTGNYNLTSVAYDKNGNITALNRKGHTNVGATSFGVMDNLVYTYDSGNKLKKVLDNGNDTYGFKDGANLTTEYVYDTNGNMISDANKDITSILYNHLDLPTEIKFNNSNTKKINYTYDADGIKLRKVTNDNGSITTIDYTDNGSVYENNVLQFIPTAEGYVTPDGSGGFDYVYQYLDHLGSIRLSYTDADGNGTIAQSEIIEENNYYAFGLKMRGFNTGVSSLGNSVAQHYKYNGKEFDDSFNETLNTYDFGARNYDPALGRWMNIDPLAEDYYEWSPYNFVYNSPLKFIDPTGEGPLWVDNGDGTFTAEKGDSAATLAKDANISNEKANEIVENQLGPNYTGEDGGLKSDVEVGDVVTVPEQAEAIVQNEKEISSLKSENLKNESLKDDIQSDVVNLDRNIDTFEMQIELVDEIALGRNVVDPEGQVGGGQGLKRGADEVKKGLRRTIKKTQNKKSGLVKKVDSLQKLINRNDSIINQRKSVKF